MVAPPPPPPTPPSLATRSGNSIEPDKGLEARATFELSAKAADIRQEKRT
jgi:hypothetical protein